MRSSTAVSGRPSTASESSQSMPGDRKVPAIQAARGGELRRGPPPGELPCPAAAFAGGATGHDLHERDQVRIRAMERDPPQRRSVEDGRAVGRRAAGQEGRIGLGPVGTSRSGGRSARSCGSARTTRGAAPRPRPPNRRTAPCRTASRGTAARSRSASAAGGRAAGPSAPAGRRRWVDAVQCSASYVPPVSGAWPAIRAAGTPRPVQHGRKLVVRGHPRPCSARCAPVTLCAAAGRVRPCGGRVFSGGAGIQCPKNRS